MEHEKKNRTYLSELYPEGMSAVISTVWRPLWSAFSPFGHIPAKHFKLEIGLYLPHLLQFIIH